MTEKDTHCLIRFKATRRLMLINTTSCYFKRFPTKKDVHQKITKNANSEIYSTQNTATTHLSPALITVTNILYHASLTNIRHVANIIRHIIPGIKDSDDLKDNKFKHCARKSKRNTENQQYNPVMNLWHTT